jgi:hypothetical protein
MTRWLTLLLAALLLAALGCGASEKDRGINSNKDRPRSTSAE